MTTPHPCTHLVELLMAERPELKSEIMRHKYFKSIEQNKDVGYNWAERDFIENYLDSWAEGFRRCYCSLVCPERKECLK